MFFLIDLINDVVVNIASNLEYVNAICLASLIYIYKKANVRLYINFAIATFLGFYSLVEYADLDTLYVMQIAVFILIALIIAGNIMRILKFITGFIELLFTSRIIYLIIVICLVMYLRRG